MSGAQGTIDPKSLIKRLAPDQLGVFEPLSAIMLLNVEDEEFRAMAQRYADRTTTAEDMRLIATINHETYHFAQTAASGYMFERERAAFQVFNAKPAEPESTGPALSPDLQKILSLAREDAGDDPEANARLDRALAMMEQRQYLDSLEARAAPGDHSVAGPSLPDFFNHLEQRRHRESQANEHGLSILGVIEGSAVVSANALMYPDDAADHVVREIATLPPVYSQLLAFTCSHTRERTIEVALPAAAVALCYERPHDAYCALVPMIAAAPAGESLARGRDLFQSPPAIESAGAWLGDALARREADDSYRIYDPIQEPLRSNQWGIDTYDLLADPGAMHKVGSFPLGMVTRTGFRGSFPDRMDLVLRMAISATVLRVASRRRAERDFRANAAGWAQGVLQRFFDRSG